ncbi:MAG: hypothetical protein ROO71_02800 [Balneola sp.]
MVLREIIIKAIEGDSLSEQQLIQLCTDFAEAYLRMRSKKDAHLFSLLSEKYRSLALDCVAELFEKKEGKLIVFEKYFLKSDKEELKQSEYQTQLRRLVFSKVNEELFNYYKAFDPSLSKIIRNIKRVLREDEISLLKYNPDTNLIFYSKLDAGKPIIPSDLLELKLSKTFKTTLSTKLILIKVGEIFKTHSHYAGSIKVNVLAEVVRNLHQFYNEETEYYNFSEHQDIHNSEIENMVTKAVKITKLDLYPSYVAGSKMSSEDFSKYFMITERILKGDYIFGKGNGKTYFEHFADIEENISKKEYRDQHRQYVEYFVKKSRHYFINQLKKEDQSAEKRH